ncbi:DUF1036 domain-containing protein [Pelagibacterium lacus]|uniref:DUF1036 domain-containing protein n=1 Tax=Pelagibacterium lacus TaxID=2282655 RepID=A0A369W070_9HYPH|nr:DUF1036 domain-containing protein [Pelagibacterium lacus]RDE08036.1 DUF1036 domain-containing protein [Pelagibacterium lacus]
MAFQNRKRSVTVLSLLRNSLLAIAVPLTAIVGTVSPAQADLRICNETQNTISIAFGYRAESGWQSEGWWVAGPEACAIVYQGDLKSRYYYLYAVDDMAGGAWDGSVYMCTQDASFTIFGVEDCLARGYERTGFFEIDVQNRTDWTMQLTEANSTNMDLQ